MALYRPSSFPTEEFLAVHQKPHKALYVFKMSVREMRHYNKWSENILRHLAKKEQIICYLRQSSI